VNACTTDDHRKSSHECAWQRPRTAAHGGEAQRKRLGFARAAAHGPAGAPDRKAEAVRRPARMAAWIDQQR
jgi:hypothetical protein